LEIFFNDNEVSSGNEKFTPFKNSCGESLSQHYVTKNNQKISKSN